MQAFQIAAVAAGIAALVLIQYLERYTSDYWTFSGVVIPGGLTTWSSSSVVRRLLWPAASGALLVTIADLTMAWAGAVAGCAAFLVVWPVIYTGRALVPAAAQSRIGTLYFIYALYVITYGLAGLGGGFAGLALTDWWADVEVSSSDIGANIVAGAIVLGCSNVLAFTARGATTRLASDVQNSAYDDDDLYDGLPQASVPVEAVVAAAFGAGLLASLAVSRIRKARP